MPDQPLSPAEQERRRSERHTAHLFVQIAVEDGTSELERSPLFSRAANISPEGLQLLVDTAISPGTSLELLVSSPEHGEAFLLRGLTRWCRQDPDGGYRLGVWLDHGLSDLSRWQAHLEQGMKE